MPKMIKKFSTFLIKLQNLITKIGSRSRIGRLFNAHEPTVEFERRAEDCAGTATAESWYEYQTGIEQGVLWNFGIRRRLFLFFQQLYFSLRYNAFRISNTRLGFFWRITFPKYPWWKKFLILIYVLLQFVLFYILAYYFTAVFSIVLFDPVIKHLATKKYNPMWHRNVSKLFAKSFLEKSWSNVLLRDNQIPRILKSTNPSIKGLNTAERTIESILHRKIPYFDLSQIAPYRFGLPSEMFEHFVTNYTNFTASKIHRDIVRKHKHRQKKKIYFNRVRGWAKNWYVSEKNTKWLDKKLHWFPKLLYYRGWRKKKYNHWTTKPATVFDWTSRENYLHFTRGQRRLYRTLPYKKNWIAYYEAKYRLWLNLTWQQMVRKTWFAKSPYGVDLDTAYSHTKIFDVERSLTWDKRLPTFKKFILQSKAYAPLTDHGTLGIYQGGKTAWQNRNRFAKARRWYLSNSTRRLIFQNALADRYSFNEGGIFGATHTEYGIYTRITRRAQRRRTNRYRKARKKDVTHVFRRFHHGHRLHTGWFRNMKGRWLPSLSPKKHGHRLWGRKQYWRRRYNRGLYSYLGLHLNKPVSSRSMLLHTKQTRNWTMFNFNTAFGKPSRHHFLVRNKNRIRRIPKRYLSHFYHGTILQYINTKYHPISRNRSQFTHGAFLQKKRFSQVPYTIKAVPSMRHRSWEVLINNGYMSAPGFKRALPALLNQTYFPKYWNTPHENSFVFVTKQDFNLKKYLFKLLLHNKKLTRYNGLYFLHAPVTRRIRFSRKKKYFFVPKMAVFDASRIEPGNIFYNSRKLTSLYTTKASQYHNISALRYRRLVEQYRPYFLSEYLKGDWEESDMDLEWFDSVNYPELSIIKARKKHFRRQRFTFKHSVAKGALIDRFSPYKQRDVAAPGYFSLLMQGIRKLYTTSKMPLEDYLQYRRYPWSGQFLTKKEHDTFGQIHNSDVRNFYNKFYRHYYTQHTLNNPQNQYIQFHNYHKVNMQAGTIEDIVPEETQHALISHFMKPLIPLTTPQLQNFYVMQSNIELSAWWNRARRDRVLRGKRFSKRTVFGRGSDRRLYRRRRSFIPTKKVNAYHIYPSMKSRASSSYSKWWPLAVSQHKIRLRGVVSLNRRVTYQSYPSLLHYVRYSLEDYRQKRRHWYKIYRYLLNDQLRKHPKVNVRAISKLPYVRVGMYNWRYLDNPFPKGVKLRFLPKFFRRNKNRIRRLPKRYKKRYRYGKIFYREWRHVLDLINVRHPLRRKRKFKVRRILRKITFRRWYRDERLRWARSSSIFFAQKELNTRVYRRAIFSPINSWYVVHNWDTGEMDFGESDLQRRFGRVVQPKVSRLFVISGRRFGWLSGLVHNKFRDFVEGWSTLWSPFFIVPYSGFLVAFVCYMLIFMPINIFLIYPMYKDLEHFSSIRYVWVEPEARPHAWRYYWFTKRKNLARDDFMFMRSWLRESKRMVDERVILNNPFEKGPEEKEADLQISYKLNKIDKEEDEWFYTRRQEKMLMAARFNEPLKRFLASVEIFWKQQLTEEEREKLGWSPDYYRWLTRLYTKETTRRYYKRYWMKKQRYALGHNIFEELYARLPVTTFIITTFPKAALLVHHVVIWIYEWLFAFSEDLLFFATIIYVIITTPDFVQYWTKDDKGDIATFLELEDALILISFVFIGFFIYHIFSELLPHDEPMITSNYVYDETITVDEEDEVGMTQEEIDDLDFEDILIHAKAWVADDMYREFTAYEYINNRPVDEQVPYDTYIKDWEGEALEEFRENQREFMLDYGAAGLEDHFQFVRAQHERLIQEIHFHGHIEFNVYFSHYLQTYTMPYYVIYTDLMQGEEWLDDTGMRLPWHFYSGGIDISPYFKTPFILRWYLWEDPYDRDAEHSHTHLTVILREGARFQTEVDIDGASEVAVDTVEVDKILPFEDTNIIRLYNINYIPRVEPKYGVTKEYDLSEFRRKAKLEEEGSEEEKVEKGTAEYFEKEAQNQFKNRMEYGFLFTYVENKMLYDLNNLESCYTETLRKKQIISLYNLIQLYPNKTFEELLLLVYKQYKTFLRDYQENQIKKAKIDKFFKPKDKDQLAAEEASLEPVTTVEYAAFTEEMIYTPDVRVEIPIFCDLPPLLLEGKVCPAEDLLLLGLIIREYVAHKCLLREALITYSKCSSLEEVIEQQQKNKLYLEYLKYK